jgi:hypothetical protein
MEYYLAQSLTLGDVVAYAVASFAAVCVIAAIERFWK